MIYRLASAPGGAINVNLMGSAVCGGGCSETMYMIEVAGTSAQPDQTGSYYSNWTNAATVTTSALSHAHEIAFSNCVTPASDFTGPDGGFTAKAMLDDTNFYQMTAYKITSSTAALTTDWSDSTQNSTIACSVMTYY